MLWVAAPGKDAADAFGRICEYFLGEFARTEGQKGRSGGVFVQSARFVAEHRKNPSDELAICGQEKVAATVALCRMNLAVHGLEGDIREAITYYEDLHESTGRFDFVLANPPFNVNAVDKERLAADVGPGRHFPFGLPRADNANYTWIQLFYSTLAKSGRAGFVMANSASDARSSAMELQRQLIEARAVDVMVGEEELTVLDILTRPGPDLSPAERDEEGLPRAYTPQLYQSKVAAVFEHMFENFQDEGISVYGRVA